MSMDKITSLQHKGENHEINLQSIPKYKGMCQT